jgi:hypothetical protein
MCEKLLLYSENCSSASLKTEQPEVWVHEAATLRMDRLTPPGLFGWIRRPVELSFHIPTPGETVDISTVRLLGPDPALAEWLAEVFVRHFGEVDGLPWEPASPERTDVELDLDLGRGLVATGADVTVEVRDVLDRWPFAMAALTLGGVEYALSNVYAPCRTAGITVAGSVVPGVPEVDESGPSSTAFLAVAESWTRTGGPPG